MKTIVSLLAVLALALSARSAHADIPACPVPDGAGNEGNPNADMSCWDFTAFATRLAKIEKDFTAAGGKPGQIAVATSYGTLKSRLDIISQIDALIDAKDFANNRAAVRAKWRALIALNNPAYLARLGVPNDAANKKRIAEVWLPINQAIAATAKKTRDDAHAAWNADKTPAKAAAYWDAQRDLLAYEELVGATQDEIDGK